MKRWKIGALLAGAAIRGAVSMKCLLFAVLSGAIATLFGGVPSPSEMRGPFPIASTPYFEDGAVDYDALAREVKWVADCGCPGVIWCQSNDAIDLLTIDEKFRGFEACAGADKIAAVALRRSQDCRTSVWFAMAGW